MNDGVEGRRRNSAVIRPRAPEYNTSASLDGFSAGPHNDVSVLLPDGSTPAPRVLIVDDDVSVTDTFSRMLRLEGYEVWAAHSADEGLTLAQTHQPHAIILDLRMPLTSGLQFLRAIRAIPGLAHTPVAIVTGDYYLDEAQSRGNPGARRRAALQAALARGAGHAGARAADRARA